MHKQTEKERGSIIFDLLRCSAEEGVLEQGGNSPNGWETNILITFQNKQSRQSHQCIQSWFHPWFRERNKPTKKKKEKKEGRRKTGMEVKWECEKLRGNRKERERKRGTVPRVRARTHTHTHSCTNMVHKHGAQDTKVGEPRKGAQRGRERTETIAFHVMTDVFMCSKMYRKEEGKHFLRGEKIEHCGWLELETSELLLPIERILRRREEWQLGQPRETQRGTGERGGREIKARIIDENRSAREIQRESKLYRWRWIKKKYGEKKIQASWRYMWRKYIEWTEKNPYTIA